MKDIKYLIIPDVHGRTFWKEPVNSLLSLDTDSKIIFLGDYHDPYPHEWGDDPELVWDAKNSCLEDSISNFKEILDLKKQYPDRVTLLIGNHDCGYAISEDICSSRMDRLHRQELEKIFKDNKELFQIAEECDIAGKHFVFSHAGILKEWASLFFGISVVQKPDFNIVDRLNNAWLTDDYGVLDTLGVYDYYRGYCGAKYGSPVWSDIRSWVRVTPEETFGYNIVGHTQLDEKPLVLDQIADLDVRRAFYLDSEGRLRDFDSEEELQKTVVQDDYA